ncbi:IclR family transcriptional regulator [Agromyces bauzanensis]|uniref:Transcriptional regulator n=1 Tax=Agromyces bauzanensis TaxID=1308924 RepID=A0A917PTU7_9MICO|nr:IclR family transcriptional regulator [Agromyces bauzanensis]GGJ91044.1 transcriptional regulator [Agromyces bauzanensis]
MTMPPLSTDELRSAAAPELRAADTAGEAQAAVDRSAYGVPAIDRAVLIMRALQRMGPLSFRDILEETGLSKSTCFSLLRTMSRLDLVEFDSERRVYRLGISLVELGASAIDQLSYLRIVKRHLTHLAADIDATFVIYRRMDQEHVSIVDKLERLHQVRVSIPVGTVVPIQGGSFGRCFMAYDDPRSVDAVLRGGLHAFTERSVTDPAVFRHELARVRECGWAIDREGFALGVSTVAAPVFGADGKVLLVIGAVAIASVLDEAKEIAWGNRLRQTCDELGEAIGSIVAVPWRPSSAGDAGAEAVRS